MNFGLLEKSSLSKKWVVLILAGLFAYSCGSSKNISKTKNASTKKVVRAENLRILESHFDGKISNSIQNILKDAERYLGVPYKFGGNSRSGLDCSGFTTLVFQDNELKLPRRSSDQAITGDKVQVESVKPGDLLFFATAGGSRVSHVGIVHSIDNNGEIKFIHASTSKGVIISSLNEKYWNKAYLHAQRVL